MRVRVPALLVAVVALAAPNGASAAFVHVVAPGESLASVAAADGLSVGQLAAANGLSSDSQLVAGTGLQIPPQGASSVASTTVAAGSTASAGDGDQDSDDPVVGDGDGDSDDVAATTAGSLAPASAATATSGSGSYVVQPGDTLSAIAARAGMSVAQLAATNGLDPAAPLVSGTALRLGGGGGPAPTSTLIVTAVTQPVGVAAQGSAVNPPYPTPEQVAPSQVASIAAANGVPPSLASAIADQESGFNNAAVSTADARGVMQILPGTWDWIQRTLVAGAPPLAPASATDNVRGGVLLLKSLLNSTGGDPGLAAAGYYQGLPSVQRNGVYPSTQQYVNDVMALARRYGGG
jgi:LysM repeat protein